MIMSMSFLKLDDIDDCWLELKDTTPDLGDEDNLKLSKFVEYLENTWISCHI